MSIEKELNLTKIINRSSDVQSIFLLGSIKMTMLLKFSDSLPPFYPIPGFGGVIYYKIRDEWNLESTIIREQNQWV